MVSSSGRSYAAAHFALELDGSDAIGLFRSIEGGGLRADVTTYAIGGSFERWRQVGKPKYEDIKLQVGMAMSEPFTRWIADFFAGHATRKTGAIVAADFSYVERARRELDGLLIKELTFPRLDATDHGAAYMTVGLAVESIAFKRGDDRTRIQPAAGTAAQKRWSAANFRLRLDGLDDACRRVTKVDAFTVKQAIAEHHLGGLLAPIKIPGAIEFPTLAFYVPEIDAQPFADAMVAQHGPLTGALDCLDGTGRTLLSVGVAGAQLVAVAPDRCDAASEDIKLVKIELATEVMSFTYNREG
jgi:hypothetical protein|nr:phage tail protein [Kofleriaceae bacterium]